MTANDIISDFLFDSSFQYESTFLNEPFRLDRILESYEYEQIFLLICSQLRFINCSSSAAVMSVTREFEFDIFSNSK